MADVLALIREPDHAGTPTTTRSFARSETLDTQTTPSPLSDTSSMPSSSAIISPGSSQQSSFLRSPSEIIHRVLCSSGAGDLKDLAHAAGTCRELRDFIYENPDQALWRDIYLQRFDDPRLAAAFLKPRVVADWKKRVQDREFVMRIFRDWDADRFEELSEHLDLIISTLLEMYLDLPANTDPPQPAYAATSQLAVEETLNGPILEGILRSDAFEHIVYHLSTRETKPRLRAQPHSQNPNRKAVKEIVNPSLSRLHLLLSLDFQREDLSHRQHRGFLRELVYTSTNFSRANDWGPFHTDGSVDWALVDAVSSVMTSNAKDVLSMGEDGWRKAVLPISFGLEPVRGWGFNDLTRPPELKENEIWDWAGVEGQWCGSYAFLDYADWITLNEPRLIQLRRQMNALDLSRYVEAIGDLMRLDLRLDRTKDQPGYDDYDATWLPPLETPLPGSDLLPPLFFHGASIQAPAHITFPSQSASSFVRGVVRLTADDPPQVRWTLIIRYGGEDRWRLECVQPGGRGAKRGFFGIWTDAHKEEHSPNGPLWYWKE